MIFRFFVSKSLSALFISAARFFVIEMQLNFSTVDGGCIVFFLKIDLFSVAEIGVAVATWIDVGLATWVCCFGSLRSAHFQIVDLNLHDVFCEL
jgi:hypothetical protein